MILADFHVHSCFCDGKDTPEKLVQSAIDKGLKKLGILVHSFVDFEPESSSSPEKMAEFVKTINCLKLKYKDKIELFCGVEQDLFSNTSYSQFDYVIASVHFFKKGDRFYPIDVSKEIFVKAVDEFFDGDVYSAIEWYFNAVSEAVEKIKPTIVGHFDLVTKFNENSTLFDEKNWRYVSAYESAIQKLIKFNIPFEINLGAISRGYRSFPYPSLDIISYIKENGGKFILSSDAHSKENIAYEFSKWQKIINFNNIIAFWASKGENMDYKKLQNGSDIRGVALEGIEGQNVNLTKEVCKNIGRGFALWLVKKLGKTQLRVAVGRDSRLSGEKLCKYLCEAMIEQGLNVTDFGMASTPAMFMSTVTDGYNFDGSVMITASHLPFNRNGFKFFTAQGGLEKADIKEILEYAEGDSVTNLEKGKLVTDTFMDTYSEILANKIRQATGLDKPLDGFKIVVDAGNGAGGFYVDKVLKPLGADTTGSRYLEPDGSFPNHIPNPENKEAMESITQAVKENNADLGIIFDTDVDRAGAVLSDGSELNRNRIIAMLSAILLREYHGTTIVTDSITSTGLAKFICENGGIHHRFKRGYRNVINESIKLNNAGQDSQLAIETSGHGALKENYFLDDGAYLVTKLLIELARGKKEGYTLQSLIANLEEPAESIEFRMNILLEDFKAYGQKVLDELNAYASSKQGWELVPNNYEGVRVNLDSEHGNGWFLLRLSLHDPLLPLNIESNDLGGARVIAKELCEFISKYDKLDAKTLIEYVK